MRFIYETPWWLPASCWLCGIILFVTGNNRMEKKLRASGLALFLLGIIIAVASYLLESPREKAIGRTRALVSAVEKRDWVKMQSMLHPQVTLVGWHGQAAIVEGAKHYAERYDLKSISITGINGVELADGVDVVVVVMTEFKELSGILTRWKLEWTETKAGWVLAAMEPLGGPGIEASQLEGRFKGPARPAD